MDLFLNSITHDMVKSELPKQELYNLRCPNLITKATILKKIGSRGLEPQDILMKYTSYLIRRDLALKDTV